MQVEKRLVSAVEGIGLVGNDYLAGKRKWGKKRTGKGPV